MNSLVSLFLLLAIPATALSQHRLTFGVLTESTAAGYEYGFISSYHTSRRLGAGIFYQANLRDIVVEEKYKSYSGMIFQVPVLVDEKLSLFGTCRAGLVDGKFVVVVPGVETQVVITHRLALHFGMSMRMNYPAIVSKIVFKILPYENCEL